MRTILRLGRYFRPLHRTIVVGVVFMTLYALFSGFSIGMILPIVDKVFVRTPDAPEPTLSVAEGLSLTWSDIGEAWGQGGGFDERLQRSKDAALRGLERVKDEAPPLDILKWLCLLSLVAVLLKNASDIGRKIAFLRVEQGAAEALRKDLFANVLAQPLSRVQALPSGQLLSRVVTDVELVKQLTINTAASFVHNLLQVVVYLLISVWASPRLALVSFVIVPPMAMVTGKLAAKLKRHSGRAQARIAELTASLSETLGALRLVKAFGTEKLEIRRFGESSARYRRTVVRLMSLDSLAAPLSEFWGVAIGVVVLYVGGRLVLSPEATMTPGRFFVFFLALVSMLHPLKQLSTVVARFQRGAAAADRVFELLDLPGEDEPADPLPLPGIREALIFERVSFAYPERDEVLREVSFRADAGTTTALVGPSGAGKTTLVDLIPRFYEPSAGRILIDGVDIARVRRDELRALIGIVGQETLLLNDTIHLNIAYGTPGATREQVVAAATAANAHEFIEDTPSGYDTVIGERGVFLSGGQRQRLAIARAVLRDPAILILDEATSSLDAESEVLVQEALERLLRGRTTLVIAHRLSTVMNADKILVLDRGRVVQEGTHLSLAATPGMYQRLYQLQFGAEEAPVLDDVEP